MSAEPLTTHDALRRAVAERWVLARPTALARAAVLRAFTDHADGAPDVTVGEALAAAHMLKGGLGAYGLREASRRAGDIEAALGAVTTEADAAVARRALSGSVAELDALLAAERSP